MKYVVIMRGDRDTVLCRGSRPSDRVFWASVMSLRLLKCAAYTAVQWDTPEGAQGAADMQGGSVKPFAEIFDEPVRLATT